MYEQNAKKFTAALSEIWNTYSNNVYKIKHRNGRWFNSSHFNIFNAKPTSINGDGFDLTTLWTTYIQILFLSSLV